MQNDDDIVLVANPSAESSLFKFPIYLVPDTNVILDQIDIFEEDAICNMIILSTVQEEVKHRSSAVYKKFRDIVGRSPRHCYVFVNEHHK